MPILQRRRLVEHGAGERAIGRVHAVQYEGVKMDVQIQRRTESLDHVHGLTRTDGRPTGATYGSPLTMDGPLLSL